MSTGKIEVWITGVGRNACQVSWELPWYVNVRDCCGEPLLWCDRQYQCIAACCGHVDIEVPPGCYVLRAGAFSGGEKPCTGQLIDLTGSAVVTVGCGQEACVTLVSLKQRFATETEEAKQWFLSEAEKMKTGQSQQPNQAT